MTGSPVTVRHEAATKRRRLLRSLSAFTVAAVAGVSLLGIRWAMRGDADPFNAGWPLYLQSGSLALTMLLACLSRQPFVAAFGVWLGLVAYMLVDGRAEYPVASFIALTVNGLLPALAGALLFVFLKRLVTSQSKKVQP